MPPPLVLRTKCILVGDSTVGKSAIVQSLLSDGTQFAKAYNMTTWVDICVKAVQVPETEVTAEFFIHDCAGKEMFTTHVQQFWDSPCVVMVVYDVTNKQTFNSCSKWIERVKAKKTSPESPLPGVLVANKVDLKERRTVEEEEGRKFASSKDLEYFECSAKEHENVEKPFVYLAKQFYRIYKEKMDSERETQ